MKNLGQHFLQVENPISKGHLSEFIAQIYFSLKGWKAYKPTGDSSRVDYVVEDGNSFIKVQVKTVFLNGNGKYEIPLAKRGKNKKLLLYTRDELDIIVAFSPHHNAIVLIPGDIAWGKYSIIFSSKRDGNYCGTSRFIEDYIVLSL